ncbi:DMT family transporter [Candidatus Dependentiae bacterium]|nr:DMT family transporter [Candidatus Dependentiae bacterium]
MILFFILYALLALSFVFAKIALNYSAPVFLIALRMSLAGILLLGYQFFLNSKKLIIKKNDVWLFFKTSLFHIYIAFTLEFWALRYLSSSKTNIIYTTTPFLTALLAYLIYGSKLTFYKTVGMLIGLFGLLPIILTHIAQEGSMLAGISFPEVIMLISVICSAYAWFLVKDLMNKNYSLLIINGYAMLIGGILAFFTSYIIGEQMNLNWNLILWISLLILVSNILFYNLYAWLMHLYSLTFLSFAGFLSPIFGAIFGYLILNEKITYHYFISLIIVFIGLYIFYKDEMNKNNL